MLIALMLASEPLPDVRKEWWKCTASAAEGYAVNTNEAAETVVAAAFGRCAPEERAVRQQEAADFVKQGGAIEDVDLVMRGYRRILREKMLVRIMDIRSRAK